MTRDCHRYSFNRLSADYATSEGMSRLPKAYNRGKTELTIEQMFDIITLGSLPGVVLLIRPINIYPGIGGVNDNGT